MLIESGINTSVGRKTTLKLERDAGDLLSRVSHALDKECTEMAVSKE
jgi:hypothetical protein